MLDYLHFHSPPLVVNGTGRCGINTAYFQRGVWVQNFTLTDSAGLARPTNMPFLIQGTGPAHYVLRGELELSGFAPRVFDLSAR